MRPVLAGLIVVAGLCTVTEAQWLQYRSAGVPRNRDGSVNLFAPAPRTADGRPDLSGVWLAESTPVSEISAVLPGGENGLGETVPNKYFLNILWGVRPEQSPARPDTAALFDKHAAALGRDFPLTRCLPAGVPLLETMPAPHKVVQTAGLIGQLFEHDTTFRQIYTDGRPLPADPTPSWQGYSVGRWDGDWLIVTSIGFTDRSWLDALGHVHSEAMRVTERMRRRDFGHTDVEITIDDANAYLRAFTIAFTKVLMPDDDVLELYCTENERDAEHIVGALRP